MFIHKLYRFFFALVIVSVLLLAYNWHKDYEFDTNPLSQKLEKQIFEKKQQTRQLLRVNFGFDLDVPLLVSEKLPSSLFGAAVFTQDEKIIIYLNKKRFKESSDYMIHHVIPHEYAHAVMFYLKDFSKEQSGHSIKWQNICKKLNGIKCDRFVDNHDIIIGKTSF
ncbi:MAG: sprT domain-containing protein [Deltaproteobacteria bacterium HGW-Deltaproteobacteria-24]|nr:MAG: sprT domain-containing protein [Deltaproteobacteria bacterium HGW-Deltaproteobacteria-24]